MKHVGTLFVLLCYGAASAIAQTWFRKAIGIRPITSVFNRGFYFRTIP